MKKVLVKGPALSLSGYGEQARFAIRSLKDREDLDLYVINIPWGKTGQISDSEEKQWLTSLVQKTAAYASQYRGSPVFDISVQVTIPNEFEKIAKTNIGYTAGIETTKVSPEWIQKCNEMDKIIVPSNHSKKVFEETVYKAIVEQTKEETDFSLKTQVDVCSFPASKREFEVPNLELATEWNFLSVAQWGPRKNVEATIKNFLAEFKNDDVGLVLKLNMSKNSTMDKLVTQQRVQNIVDKFKKDNEDVKCKVYLLHGNMTEEEMMGLYNHPKIKAFVTTTHGEGFGLPMFDAATYELPVIAPAWSSYIDFLYAPKKIKGNKEKSKPHFTKIDFDLKKVQQAAVWKGVIQADSQWCFVKDHSTRSAMREVVKNYGPKLSDAKKLSKFILENLNKEKQSSLFCDLVYKKKIIKPQTIKNMSFCIPTNGKRKEKTIQTIESIRKQKWGDNITHEIIVCGDVEFLKDVKGIKILDNKEAASSKNVSMLRNHAAEESSYDVIVFCDDDIILDTNWLENTLDFSQDSGWEILGNKILNPDGTRHWDKALLTPRKLVDYEHSDDDSNLMQTSGFFLIRKEVFSKIKWDETKLVYADREKQGIPEDVQFNIDFRKKGYSLKFNASATVWHNDDSYTEVMNQTLKKQTIEQIYEGFNFPEECLEYKNLLEFLND